MTTATMEVKEVPTLRDGTELKEGMFIDDGYHVYFIDQILFNKTLGESEFELVKVGEFDRKTKTWMYEYSGHLDFPLMHHEIWSFVIHEIEYPQAVRSYFWEIIRVSERIAEGITRQKKGMENEKA
jgi:hypothetical protein